MIFEWLSDSTKEGVHSCVKAVTGKETLSSRQDRNRPIRLR